MVTKPKSLKVKPEQTKEEFKELKEKYSFLLECISDGVMVLDRKWQYVLVNDQLAHIAGMPKEKLLGNKMTDLFPGIEKTVFYKIYKEVMKTGKPAVGSDEFTFEGGRKGWYEVHAYPAPEGLLVIVIDITERKKAEEELRESEAKFRNIFESSMIGVLFWDKDGNITDANELFLQMVGYTKKEVLSGIVRWRDMTTPEYTHLDDKGLEEIAETGTMTPIEKEYICKDGSRVPILLGAGILKGYKDRGVAYVVDITDKKQAEEELEKHREHLEELVKERTEKLEKEIAEGKKREGIIKQQSQEIFELSVPVMQVWQGVVVAPLIGTLDSKRTQQFMEQLLNTIVETNSSFALVDITGVPTIDTQTAQNLLETISAVKLLGAQVVLTGVQPGIAQTLVHLGIDLSAIDTRSLLSAGLQVALDTLGFQVVKKEKAN